jgi:hypothetical protein
VFTIEANKKQSENGMRLDLRSERGIAVPIRNEHHEVVRCSDRPSRLLTQPSRSDYHYSGSSALSNRGSEKIFYLVMFFLMLIQHIE